MTAANDRPARRTTHVVLTGKGVRDAKTGAVSPEMVTTATVDDVERRFVGVGENLAAALAGELGDVRKWVSRVVQAALEGEGVDPAAARAALRAVGHRMTKDDREALYRGAWFTERVWRELAERNGAPTKGIHSRVMDLYAKRWSRASGQDDYTAENFRKSFDDWLKRTGGGIGRKLPTVTRKGKKPASK